MDDRERIRKLELELHNTRLAAISMMLGMSEAIAQTPEGREELARGFDAAATMSDPITAQLARLTAEALRKR